MAIHVFKDMEFYVDGWLYDQITKNIQVRLKKKDEDYVCVIDGREGVGKSVFAQQLAATVDPNFGIENIAFTPEEFHKLILKSKPNSAIVFDEAFTGLSSRSALSAVNKLLVSLMMEMRQKNLFVIIVLPTFYVLERYVALFRASSLFHVYKDKKGRKGNWAFYGQNAKKYLYINGKQLMEYSGKNIPKHNRSGKFTDKYTVDEQKYRELKKKALMDKNYDNKMIDEENVDRDKIITYLYDEWDNLKTNDKMTFQFISDMCKKLDIKLKSPQAVSQAIKRFKKRNKEKKLF